MSGHTPKPWKSSRVQFTTRICAEMENGRADLADVFDQDEYNGRLPAEANARLMAAAPGLLDALRNLLAVAEQHAGDIGFGGVFREAREAISRAESATPG